MSRRAQSALSIVVESPRAFFVDRVEGALSKLKFQPSPLSRQYLVDLLQHYMISTNLFTQDEESGRLRRETLAETYLKAENSPPPVRLEMLKKLGDSSLYISGFFGDSLSSKVVDIDYYVQMGGTAYSALSKSANDEHAAQMYEEYYMRFTGFVDVLTYISQQSRIQSNEDLLKLYDRYLSTGSSLAKDQLMEKGLLNAETVKAKKIAT